MRIFFVMLNNPIQVLKQTELCGRQFSVYGTTEEPLFKANEVATIIEHSTITKMLALVDEDEKGVYQLSTPGGNQQVWMLTEGGLYEVLLQSRKPIAKQFKKGVKQILHEVRTTGGYLATKQDDTPEEIMARALTIAQATLEKREERLKQLESDNQQKDAKIAKLQPKADFADAAFTTDDKVDIGMAAKILKLGFGRNTLFQKLRQVGVFFSNRNEPKQRFVNAGYFEMKEKFIERNSHPGFVVTKILVTQKGLAYINHLFGGNPSDGKIAAIE